MSISIKSVTCPQCGASANYEEDREKLFCSYCGAQIIITNDNEHIYRRVDEAEIKRAETERIETLADIENNKSSKVLLYAKYIVTGILLFLGIALMIIGANNGNLSLRTVGMFSLLAAAYVGFSCISNNKKNRTHVKNGIRITSAIANSYGENYESIASIMKSVGFSNITCVPMNDLNLLTIRKKGQIESLVIDGEENISEGDEFPANAAVVISYHSFRSGK